MTNTMQGDALEKELATLDGWQSRKDGKAIGKLFKFGDFREAMAFMNSVADDAERLDHHPDWSNTYNEVDVTLSTHDAGGVTEKDIELARCMDRASA